MSVVLHKNPARRDMTTLAKGQSVFPTLKRVDIDATFFVRSEEESTRGAREDSWESLTVPSGSFGLISPRIRIPGNHELLEYKVRHDAGRSVRGLFAPRSLITVISTFNPWEPEHFVLPRWVDEVVPKMAELLRLEENWDSYGARRIRPDCIFYVLNSVLFTCMQAATPVPALVPLNNGGVALEWHCRQIDLEVRVEEPGFVYMYFCDTKDQVEEEKELKENLRPLSAALFKLTQRLP